MPKRVMLVEDEALIAMDVAAELEDAGHDVLGPFGREDEALAALERDAPDVALLDVNLGEGDSFALADALRAQGAAVIFLSGHGRDFLPERFRGCALLPKPIAYPRLLDALGRTG